jgi:hypothetical protein
MPHQSRRVFCDETQREINLQHALPQIPHEACVNKKRMPLNSNQNFLADKLNFYQKKQKKICGMGATDF